MLFCDRINSMKNKISFLSILAAVGCMNFATASECVGNDCELNVPTYLDWFETYQVPESTQYETNPVTQSGDNVVYSFAYVCPFETESECDAWYRKPVYKTNIIPQNPHINSIKMDNILYAVQQGQDISANNQKMSPLLERYQMLMRASRACCSAGILYKMREKGASDQEIYEFLKDDANEYAVASRCMVLGDDELRHSYSNGVTGTMVADVRNACICKNRQWFEDLLQPFVDLYNQSARFEDSPFPYTYTDDMQRNITVYINQEVETTCGLLSACPK